MIKFDPNDAVFEGHLNTDISRNTPHIASLFFAKSILLHKNNITILQICIVNK